MHQIKLLTFLTDILLEVQIYILHYKVSIVHSVSYFRPNSMMLASSDVFTQLQPRHVCRRERKPGARERHSALRQRHATDLGPSAVSIQKSSAESTTQRGKSYYCMDSAISEFSRNKRNENTEKERVTSSYKEVSTIDAIQATMKATAKPKSAPPPHIPRWMLDLDINLNVSSVDIIPPFGKELKASERDSETFNETASLIFVNTDSDDSENDNAFNRVTTDDLDTERRKHVNYKSQEGDRVQSSRPHSRQNESVPSSRSGIRPMSNTFRIARGFSPTGNESESKFFKNYIILYKYIYLCIVP